MAIAILMLSCACANMLSAALWASTMRYDWSKVRRAWLVRDLTMVGLLLASGILNTQTSLRVLDHPEVAGQIQLGRAFLAFLAAIATGAHYIANHQKSKNRG